MSYGELKGYSQKFGFGSSLLHIKTTENSLKGKLVKAYDEDQRLLNQGIFNQQGLLDLPVSVRGTVTLKSNNGTVDTESSVYVGNYGVYNVNMSLTILYQFRVSKSNTDPASRVQYLGDSADLEPAKMNYTTGKFDYGSFKNAFFMPKPVMLNSNGKVAYYLNPNNYKKKENGENSDVSNTNFDGNAMMEFPTVWLYIYEDANYEYYNVANKKINASYEAYAHHDKNGKIMKHTYMPIYNGSLVNNKLRSLSGRTILNSATAPQEITYAQANGPDIWYTELLCDRMLVNILLMLIGKSTDTQAVFGNGHYIGGAGASDLLVTGTMDDKGLFWGTNGTGSGVKVFGMENWWGNQWRRIGGWLNVSGVQKIKMTYGTEDGSTAQGYNTSGSGYITLTGANPTGTSGGYISKCQANKYGKFPYQASGSETTYEPDGLWFASGTMYACVGGYCDSGFRCGAFASVLYSAASYASWGVGASVSCKPTVEEEDEAA